MYVFQRMFTPQAGTRYTLATCGLKFPTQGHAPEKTRAVAEPIAISQWKRPVLVFQLLLHLQFSSGVCVCIVGMAEFHRRDLAF